MPVEIIENIEPNTLVVNITAEEDYDVNTVTFAGNTLNANAEGYYELAGEGELQYCVSATGYNIEFRLSSTDSGLSQYSEIFNLPFIDLGGLNDLTLSQTERIDDGSTPTITCTLFDPANGIDYRQIILDNIEVKDTNGNVLYSPTANRMATTDDYGRVVNFNFNLNAVTQDIIVEFTTSYCMLLENNNLSTKDCRLGIGGTNITTYDDLTNNILTYKQRGSSVDVVVTAINQVTPDYVYFQPVYNIGFQTGDLSINTSLGVLESNSSCGVTRGVEYNDCVLGFRLGTSNDTGDELDESTINTIRIYKNGVLVDTNPSLTGYTYNSNLDEGTSLFVNFDFNSYSPVNNDLFEFQFEGTVTFKSPSVTENISSNSFVKIIKV